MKVHTFFAKVSTEGLHHNDELINEWLTRHPVKPLHITQSFGQSRHHDGRSEEPILITSLWYEES